MWNEITNQEDIDNFMTAVHAFHDSCIKELKYISGAYVSEELSMYPVNDCRRLSILVQRQSETSPVIELEFAGLMFLRFFPCDDTHTCEIIDSSMVFQDGLIYWCDCGDVTVQDIANYEGTLVCASKLRWRSVEHSLGSKEFYTSAH